jgi:hypothetical protein
MAIPREVLSVLWKSENQEQAMTPIRLMQRNAIKPGAVHAASIARSAKKPATTASAVLELELGFIGKRITRLKPAERASLMRVLMLATPFCWKCGGDYAADFTCNCEGK